MAAKEAILELLKKCSFPNEVLTDKILACVRQHKLGIVPVARNAKEALNLERLDSETFGTTVESHVRAMVDMARRNDDTVLSRDPGNFRKRLIFVLFVNSWNLQN